MSYLTLGNCNLSWEEGVSLGDLPLNNYSHDKAINQAASSPALGRTADLFAVMLSHLRGAPVPRKADGGALLSAGGPAEADISPQSQTRVEIRPKCLKDERDLSLTHRWLLSNEVAVDCEQINEISLLFKDAKEAPNKQDQ